MYLDEYLKIEIVVIEIKNDGSTGNCYDTFYDFRKKHPDSSYKFGFVVAETTMGVIPDGYDDWYYSVDEAFNAWMMNKTK